MSMLNSLSIVIEKILLPTANIEMIKRTITLLFIASLSFQTNFDNFKSLRIKNEGKSVCAWPPYLFGI